MYCVTSGSSWIRGSSVNSVILSVKWAQSRYGEVSRSRAESCQVGFERSWMCVQNKKQKARSYPKKQKKAKNERQNIKNVWMT